MNRNIGTADRSIRIILAIIFGALYFTNTVTGTFGIVLLVFAGILLLTSLVSFCPLYALTGLNTNKEKKPQ